MNVSVPQEIGLVEAMTVGSTVYYAVSAQNGAPVMGCVQNTLAMAGVCTNIFDSPRLPGDKPTCKLPDGRPGYEILISRDTAHDAYTQAEIPAAKIREYLKRVEKVYPEYVVRSKDGLRFAEYITGKVLYSIVFPANLRWKRETNTNKIYPVVKIHDGILERDSGPLCKSCIGGTAGSIVHLMWRIHPRTNQAFINQLGMISGILNYRVGLTFSFGDALAKSSISKDIKLAIGEANQTVKMVLEKNLDPEEEEKEINRAYNKVRDISSSVAKNMEKGMHSSLSILTGFGIKGNVLNVSQTAGIVGQQNVAGKRIPWYTTNGTRVTSHFLKNDRDPEAKGLVPSNYLGGLSPTASFQAAVSGREGVVDSGTKTADSGYLQKKMSKFLGDTTAKGDGTLRNAQGQIISSFYGGDGLNPKMKIFSHSPELGIINGPRAFFFSKLDHIIGELESDFERSDKKSAKRLITKEEAEAITSRIQAGMPGYQSSVSEQSTKNQREKCISFLTTASTYPEILPDLAEKITDDYERAKIYYGFPAGLVACLSIGEITTQLTLNTFHVAGLGEKNAMVGIPRLNEIVNVSRDPKKPTMTIYPAKELDPSKLEKIQGLRRCRELANSLKYQTLEDFTKGEPTLQRVGKYNPEKESPLSFEGNFSQYKEPQWMTWFCRANGISIGLKDVEWVILIELDRQKSYDSGVTPWDVAEAIEKYHLAENSTSPVMCIPSPSDIGQVLVFLDSDDAGNYARELMTYPEGMNVKEFLITEKNVPFFAAREVAKSLVTIPIQGIQGIQKAFPRLEGDQWVIDTFGSNFLEVLADPQVDPTRTMSDNIREVERTLGIEAARAFLESELKKVIRFDGASVDDAHFMLVADAMSFSGALTPISRYGISRDVGPISKLMFERPIAEATNSVVHGDVDQIRTIDAAVYMGQAPKLGTGCVKVISGEMSRSSVPTEKRVKAEKTKSKKITPPKGRGRNAR